MSTGFIIQTVVEILMAAAVIFAVLKEKKLIEFEEKLADRIRSRRVVKRGVIIKASEKAPHCA